MQTIAFRTNGCKEQILRRINLHRPGPHIWAEMGLWLEEQNRAMPTLPSSKNSLARGGAAPTSHAESSRQPACRVCARACTTQEITGSQSVDNINPSAEGFLDGLDHPPLVR